MDQEFTHQFFVGTDLHNPTLIHENDSVHTSNGRKTVGNDDGRYLSMRRREVIQNRALSPCVYT